MRQWLRELSSQHHVHMRYDTLAVQRAVPAFLARSVSPRSPSSQTRSEFYAAEAVINGKIQIVRVMTMAPLAFWDLPP